VFWPELHPSFDAGSPPCSSPQSHEILLNKGMKYWKSGLNAGGSRTFTAATVYREQQWLVEGVQEKEGQGKLSLAPNLMLNWVPCPLWSPVYFLFHVFWNLIHYVTKQGVPVPSFPDFNNLISPVYNRCISPGQKWWRTVLDIEISCTQWEGSARTQSALFFLFIKVLGEREEEEFFLLSFVPNMFP